MSPDSSMAGDDIEGVTTGSTDAAIDGTPRWSETDMARRSKLRLAECNLA